MKFVIYDKKDKMQLVNYLKDIESPYTVDVKKHRNTRSNVQNNYYWKCIVQVLAQELGYFNDEMHDILRANFKHNSPEECIKKAIHHLEFELEELEQQKKKNIRISHI